ncbi:hypothetical protein Hden_1553 [Hyphomicrobium denitrificans ATCC 51888]|uniref:Uncharacterized protein n=1 Tax=Hyphomicrobium denitrificans (strain ATCC 51888 / DSM 1869 / NCIMB 11706 / TK 0415) TaxID=582899 RepID=D8JQ39_HYPDA|nr:hypothetical protein [Hyphomicrobium denitrificans]ADJ21960.1 hypothetical protein Hden_0133 [Hyphomicrobium denitrificans ATCC 51888]ADJ23365.1 hypothetical protein Hden_1553 [Hyphomicrobium denitrificans ATCC 51888]
MDDEIRGRLTERAADVAFGSMIKILVTRFLWSEDRDTFRRRLASFETAVVNDINVGPPWPKVPDEWNKFAQEAASGFATQIIASIVHKTDDP